jgi:excisionase family DNA binding protein
MTSPETLKPQAPKAASRWIQIPVVNGDVIVRRDGSMAVLEDEVATSEAAEMLGCSRRYIQQLCDEGKLLEGRDWRKVFAQGARGRYRVRRAAVLDLRFAADTVASQPPRRGRIHFKRFG